MGAVKMSSEFWTGYLLKFGDPVPGAEEFVYIPSASYNLGRLYTQGDVTMLDGSYPVGQIAHIKKDDTGVYVIVQLSIETLPEALLTVADQLVWAFIVDSANCKFAFVDNPQTGEKVKVLSEYPLVSVHYTVGGSKNGLQAPRYLINRPAGKRRKSSQRSGTSEPDPAADS